MHEGDREAWLGKATDGSVVKIDALGRMLSSSTADPATYTWVPAVSMRMQGRGLHSSRT